MGADGHSYKKRHSHDERLVRRKMHFRGASVKDNISTRKKQYTFGDAEDKPPENFKRWDRRLSWFIISYCSTVKWRWTQAAGLDWRLWDVSSGFGNARIVGGWVKNGGWGRCGPVWDTVSKMPGRWVNTELHISSHIIDLTLPLTLATPYPLFT